MTSVAESNTGAIAVVDERDLGAFIPSFLDDFGLDVYQFRVYCRLARRAGAGGQCWESINNIANACRINRKTVMQAIKGLKQCNMIHQIKRPGQTDVYRLTSRKHWVNPDNAQPVKPNKYQEFLQSDYWKKIRQTVLERDVCCQYCKATAYLQVHHLTYKHHGFEDTHLEDLITLCEQCHSEIHLK